VAELASRIRAVDSNIAVSGNAEQSAHCDPELMLLRVVLCAA
jgi:hypothetical protein